MPGLEASTRSLQVWMASLACFPPTRREGVTLSYTDAFIKLERKEGWQLTLNAGLLWGALFSRAVGPPPPHPERAPVPFKGMFSLP